jgi:hypothetical protein
VRVSRYPKSPLEESASGQQLGRGWSSRTSLSSESCPMQLGLLSLGCTSMSVRVMLMSPQSRSSRPAAWECSAYFSMASRNLLFAGKSFPYWAHKWKPRSRFRSAPTRSGSHNRRRTPELRLLVAQVFANVQACSGIPSRHASGTGNLPFHRVQVEPGSPGGDLHFLADSLPTAGGMRATDFHRFSRMSPAPGL